MTPKNASAGQRRDKEEGWGEAREALPKWAATCN